MRVWRCRGAGGVQECRGVQGRVQEYTVVHRGAWGYAGVHGVHRGTQGYTQGAWVHGCGDAQGCTEVHTGTQGYTGAHMGTQRYPGVHRAPRRPLLDGLVK